MACVDKQLSMPSVHHCRSSTSCGNLSSRHQNLRRQRYTFLRCEQEGKLTCTEVMEPLLVVVMRS